MTTSKKNNKLHIILWVLQGILSFMFIAAGATKTFQPIEILAESMPWVTSVPSELVRFIGIAELLGGLGLILPSILKIRPKLTVYASLGLALIMLLAAGFHGTRGEFGAIGANAFFLLAFLFIAWGRNSKAPIQSTK